MKRPWYPFYEQKDLIILLERKDYTSLPEGGILKPSNKPMVFKISFLSKRPFYPLT